MCLAYVDLCTVSRTSAHSYQTNAHSTSAYLLGQQFAITFAHTDPTGRCRCGCCRHRITLRNSVLYIQSYKWDASATCRNHNNVRNLAPQIPSHAHQSNTRTALSVFACVSVFVLVCNRLKGCVSWRVCLFVNCTDYVHVCTMRIYAIPSMPSWIV